MGDWKGSHSEKMKEIPNLPRTVPEMARWKEHALDKMMVSTRVDCLAAPTG